MNGLIGTMEAAERLKLSVRRVQALIAAGRLPAERVGNSFAIRESDLKTLEGRKAGRPKPDSGDVTVKRAAVFRRFAGAVDGLPSDLASNTKKYLEGFGSK